MEKAISAADANRKFSQILREVKEGRSYVVTCWLISKHAPCDGAQSAAGSGTSCMTESGTG
jgi:hypothetical protein